MPLLKTSLKHRLINLLESLLLILAMITLLAFCSYLIWGIEGIWLVTAMFISVLLVTPSISPTWLMRLYRAQILDEYSFPQGIAIINQLAHLANLPTVPKLYYIFSPSLNAFSAGHPQNSAIAITEGILESLNKRELSCVLAHEISHIRNNDLWIMGLADLISQLTSVMAQLGIILLIFNMPFMFAGEISWLLVCLLIFSPLISSIMQLTLSRIREYDADLFAANLTNDPQGLAQALQKVGYFETKPWQRKLFSRGRTQIPSFLRSHPSTNQRIERLLALAHHSDFENIDDSNLQHSITPKKHSKWRWPGFWY